MLGFHFHRRWSVLLFHWARKTKCNGTKLQAVHMWRHVEDVSKPYQVRLESCLENRSWNIDLKSFRRSHSICQGKTTLFFIFQTVLYRTGCFSCVISCFLFSISYLFFWRFNSFISRLFFHVSIICVSAWYFLLLLCMNLDKKSLLSIIFFYEDNFIISRGLCHFPLFHFKKKKNFLEEQ